MPWLTGGSDGVLALGDALGHRPEWWSVWVRNYETLYALVGPSLAELCRLLMAELLDCGVEKGFRFRSAVEDGFAEEKVEDIENWRDSGTLTPAERTCLAFVEQCYFDPKSVSDEHVNEMRRHLTDERVFALMHLVGMFEMTQRALLLFGIARTNTETVTIGSYANTA